MGKNINKINGNYSYYLLSNKQVLVMASYTSHLKIKPYYKHIWYTQLETNVQTNKNGLNFAMLHYYCLLYTSRCV